VAGGTTRERPPILRMPVQPFIGASDGSSAQDESRWLWQAAVALTSAMTSW
jgi:hypothetical protein